MMKYHKNNVDKIYKVAPVIVYDATEDASYILKQGVYLIEYDDKTISTLDIKNNVDITNFENIEVEIYNKSKIKVIFEDRYSNISNNDKR